MDAYMQEKKQKFETAFGKGNIHSADSAWRDYFNIAKDCEQLIVRIVKNFRTIFLHDKIFVHTIKGENQSIPVIKSFFSNPTVINFEILAKYHWLYHIKPRLNNRTRVWEDIDARVLENAEADDTEDYQIEPRAKRMNHSDAEKRRIKERARQCCWWQEIHQTRIRISHD